MEVVSVICTSPPSLEETCSDKFKLHLRTCISISSHEFLLSYHLSCELSATSFPGLGDEACLLINFSMEHSTHKTLRLHRKKVKICYPGLSQTQMGKRSREKSQLSICTADLYFVLMLEGVPPSRCVQTMQTTDPQCRSDARILLTG